MSDSDAPTPDPNEKTTPKPITELLRRWRGGEGDALGELVPLVQDELKIIAQRHLRAERHDHTLQSTALINEAYMRLVDIELEWQDRAHFFAMAARIMRRILVDHARTKRRDKRGGQWTRLSLDQLSEQATPKSEAPDVVDLDDALSKLAEFDDRKSQVLELTYFGGMTYDETAEALSISTATVHRELRLARAWLQRELGAADGTATQT